MTIATISTTVRPAAQPHCITPNGNPVGEVPFTVQSVVDRGDGYLLVCTDSRTTRPFVWRLPAQGHRWIREFDRIAVIAAIDLDTDEPAERDGTFGDVGHIVCVADRAEPRGHAAAQRYLREHGGR